MNIEEVLKLASDTKALRLGDGILSQVADLFKEQFPGKRAIVIADTTTFEVAGKQVTEYLNAGDVEQDKPYVFPEKDLFAEYHYIDRLVEIFQKTEAIPVAVGSGTINDLTKLSSFLTNRRYMCVGTAPSMDGYTSYGASITKDGAKQTFNCPAPQAWLGDTSIICQAPEPMMASGFGDLYAKVVCGADWIIADELGAEPIDKNVWSIVQDGLLKALGNPKAIHERDPKAVGDLVEGLILSGFAMQAMRSSRPASGAEHQFSHLWNMEHLTNHGKMNSHGFQVSIGTLASAALYEEALKTKMEDLDVEACCKAWPTKEELAKDAIDKFKDTDFPNIGLTETGVKYIPKDQLKVQLERLKIRWPILKERLAKQLIPFDEMKASLQYVGAPVEPEQIGVSREYLKRSYIRAQYIRRRFTILDLAVRTNLLNKWVDNLFDKGGRWQA
jgi:glycerol-1-phosphate dehydrogenase [NAD(P)+]